MSKKYYSYLILFLLFVFLGGLFYIKATSPKSIDKGAEIVPSATPSAMSTAATLDFQVGTKEEAAASHHQLTSDVEIRALDLVQSKLKAEFKTYDFGLLLESVDGLRADTSHYWAIYYNGEYAEVGLSDLMIKKGDVLELVYEEIVL